MEDFNNSNSLFAIILCKSSLDNMHGTYFNKPKGRSTFIPLNKAKQFLIHKFKIPQTDFTAVHFKAHQFCVQ